jgi:hypothetical protein
VSSACEIEGRTFTLPSSVVALDRGDRAAVALLTGGAVRFGDDWIEDSLEAGAVDLSLVRQGRCPLLMEHSCRVEYLLGQVLAAEVQGPVMHAVVRFARGPDADRLWGMLEDGFPLSLSAGALVQHAVAVEGSSGARVWRVTRWQLREVSVVVYGKDKDAYLRSLGRDEDAATMVARMNAVAGGAARAAVRHNLHLDDWESWAIPAGVRLAERLGADSGPFCDLLAAEVQQRCEQLISDLAV